MSTEHDKLVEDCARAICFERAGPACRCKAVGSCQAPIENLMNESNATGYQARAALAIAVERCAASIEGLPTMMAASPKHVKATGPKECAAAIRALLSPNDRGQA